MNLDNLKPAWKQFLLINSMQPLNQEEILLIIEHTDGQMTRRLQRLLTNPTLFIVLMLCCQAG